MEWVNESGGQELELFCSKSVLGLVFGNLFWCPHPPTHKKQPFPLLSTIPSNAILVIAVGVALFCCICYMGFGFLITQFMVVYILK